MILKRVIGVINPHYVKDHIYALLRQIANHNKLAKIVVKDNKVQGRFNVVLLIKEKDVKQLSNKVTQLQHQVNDLKNQKTVEQ